jgi:peptidoglycan/LPS O-acetylase OafA/YrhL
MTPFPGPRAAEAARLPSLTGLRWVAAFTVFAYHVRNFGYFSGTARHLADWAFGPGTAGVSFFFILSGFVLAWSARPGDRAVMFWRRRLARIYPVYLVTAAVSLVLACTFVPVLRPAGVGEAVANLLLVSSWRHVWWQALDPVSWSLTCEAFFYAVFPLLHHPLQHLGRRAWAVLFWAALLAVVAWPWGLLHYHHLRWWWPVNPLTRLPEFLLGVAAARLVRLGAWRGPGPEISVGLALAGYLLTAQVPWPFGTAACTGAGLVCLIAASAKADIDGRPSPWCRRWLVRLGEWSYSFYMVHVLVLYTGERVFRADPRLPLFGALTAAAVSFTVSLSAAWLLHRCVEEPSRRLLQPKAPAARA